MDLEELEPRKAKPHPKNLDPMSVEELTDYIANLKAEIARVEEVAGRLRRGDREQAKPESESRSSKEFHGVFPFM